MIEATPSPTKQDIERFLVEHIAEALQVPSSDIDVERPLVAYGLDSASTVAISGELEAWLRIRLPPLLLYDNPTIHALSSAIVDKLQGSGS